MHEKVDVDAFRSAVARIEILERTAASDQRVTTFKRWLIGITLTVCGLMITMVSVLANAYFK